MKYLGEADISLHVSLNRLMETIIPFKEKKWKVQAVMFDLDGTLIDSIPTYFRLMASVMDTLGLPQAPKSQITDFMTRGLPAFENMIPVEMHYRKEELIKEFLSLGREKLRSTFQKEVELIPGVDRLFSEIALRKIPIGVVSSTHRAYMDLKLTPLARKGLKASLASVIATEDAPRKKPAPDPLIACARELAVPPSRCIYIGDSHVDIRAGRKAGMMTIGVLTGLHDRETLENENPTMILDSVADLTPYVARNLI